jgi:hypothetical protein
VGELIRKRTGPFSRWQMRDARDIEVQEPWILDPEGKEHLPMRAVYFELADEDAPHSFYFALHKYFWGKYVGQG